MNEWELSFAELQVARHTVYKYYLSVGKAFGMAYETDCERAIACAAQKKLVAWMAKQGITTCSRHAFPGTFELPIHVWQSLETALGVK